MKRSKFFSVLPYIFGAGALLMLLIKLPGVAFLLKFLDCTRCVEDSPLIAALGGGYFAGLMTLAALFPSFPGRRVAWIGLIWAILLGIFFTFIFSETICSVCLTAHTLHVLMWLTWIVFPRVSSKQIILDAGRRFLIVILVAVGTFVVYWGGNAALEAYDKHLEKAYLASVGEKAPPFYFTTVEGKRVTSRQFQPGDRIYLNFVLQKCGFCKEQIPQLNILAKAYGSSKHHFFNIVERPDGDVGQIVQHFEELGPDIEIVLDRNKRLRNLFDVTSFPTLVILDGTGRIEKIIIGASLQYDPEFKQVLSQNIEALQEQQTL